MNSAEPFGPASAQEAVEDGLGLIVEGVRGGDGIGVAIGQQGPEPGIAQLARGLFEGLLVAGCCGGSVDAMQMKGKS